MALPALAEAARLKGVLVCSDTPMHVESGAAFGLGADYYRVGRTRRGMRRGLRRALRAEAQTAMRERVRRLGMGLEERLAGPMGSLSGGQRQALTLLIATWLKPSGPLLKCGAVALSSESGPASNDVLMRYAPAPIVLLNCGENF